MTQEEITNIFIKTMQAHADPRPYDWWIFWVAVASAVVSVVITSFIYCRQSAILKQQNRIALFEKRHALIQIVDMLTNNVGMLSIKYSVIKAQKISYDQETDYRELLRDVGAPVVPAYAYLESMQAPMIENSRKFVLNNLRMIEYIFELDTCGDIELQQIIDGFNEVCEKFRSAKEISIIHEVLCNFLEVLTKTLLIKKMQSQLAIHGKTQSRVSPSTTPQN